MERRLHPAPRHRRVAAPLVALLLLAPMLGLGAAPAAADPVGTVSVYPGGFGPSDIVTGPDGNLWFGNTFGASIGRVTPDGVFSYFTTAGMLRSESLTVGPDGNIWFAARNSGNVGKVTMTGDITLYAHPTWVDGDAQMDITAGPDGNLWVANVETVSKVTTDGDFTVFTDPGNLYAYSITAGPDGNLWFGSDLRIGKVTTSGAFTYFDTPPISLGTIVAGPDGALWFGSGARIGRITTAGDMSLFSHPDLSYVGGVAPGPDGEIWYTDGNVGVGSISMAGSFTTYPDPALCGGSGIVEGPDGRMWYGDWCDQWGPWAIHAMVAPEAPGQITGTVIEDGTGTPLAGISVRLLTTGDVVEAVTTTAADGSWSFEDPPLGDHHLRFVDLDGSHVTEWYDDLPTRIGAAAVTVTAGATTVVSADLAPAGGSVGGTLLEDGTGTPLAGVSVRLLTTGNVLEASTTTAADGSWSFSAPTVGDHRVRFVDLDGSHAGEWYDDRPTHIGSTAVTVTAGASIVVPASLAPAGGSVQGTVLEDGTGTPLAGISVRLLTTGNVLEASRITAADGSFTFNGASLGDHHVRFIDLDGSHVNEWYDDQPTAAGAASVTVVVGSTTVDAGLAPSL